LGCFVSVNFFYILQVNHQITQKMTPKMYI